MKRKSNFIGRFSLKAMVSRTTIFRICIWNILVIVCVSDSGNGENLNYQMKQVRTTPMVPNHGERVIRETIKHETILNDQFNNSNSNYKNSNNNNNNNNTLYVNQSSLSIGNELWDGIIHDCYRRPTISCFQKNVFSYLDKTLDVNDINITNRIMLFKNQVDYTKYTKEINQPNIDDMDNEIPNESRSESPIEEVTDALYGKSVKFVMTHDIELKMPEIMFDGATFRISPRSIEGNGALVKLELIPKTEIESRETGRIFKKKIAKFLKNKLLLSFLALIIIIKLIKIKIFWLLPIVIGVGAAKKLILKFLLFLFPALSHLFKLCSYYHENYHQTKFHHHHHLINHQHTVVPQWFDHGEQHSAVLPNGPELIFTNPPKGNPAEYLHGGHHGGHHGGPPPHIGPIHNGPPSHGHYPPSGWENSGPGLGSE